MRVLPALVGRTLFDHRTRWSWDRGAQTASEIVSREMECPQPLLAGRTLQASASVSAHLLSVALVAIAVNLRFEAWC